MINTQPQAGSASDAGRILLTGGSGYVGGRLLPLLESTGRPLRCLARRPEYLRPRVAESTEVVQADVLDAATLPLALEGVHTAYYLVHSMGAAEDFEENDRRGASNFARAALDAGVRRVIYLGGLGHGDDLSAHLRSRQEVGRILRESGVPTLEFRASVVIGSGSLSFEMVRALTEKLPIMITPRWVWAKAQPISIEDLLDYLFAALTVSADRSTVYEIGGSEVLPYAGIMREYARQRGLRRVFVPVPVLTPRISSLWLGLVTPLYARVGRKLIDGLRNATVVRDDRALREFDIRPGDVSQAIARALVNEDREFASTRWSDAFSSTGEPEGWGGKKVRSRVVDSRTVRVPVEPSRAFAPIRRIGGRTGWYFGDWLWGLRGFLDLLVGGVGTRRGRRDPDALSPGDTLDFWRVEAFEPDHLLRLQAEMRIPGRAWLQFEVEPDDNGSCIRQTAVFDPSGLLGLAYWYLLFPLHVIVFRGMLHGIARSAIAGASSGFQDDSPPPVGAPASPTNP